MIPISKKNGVNIVLTCFAYRNLHTLSGVLAIGSDGEVEIAVTSLSERQILRISGADLTSVPDGLTKGSFTVFDSSGNQLIKLMLEFDIVASVSYTSPVREIVCVVPHIPNIGPKCMDAVINKVDTAIDKIVSGETKIKKLLFVDEDNVQYEVSAMSEDGLPTIKVVNVTASE